MPEEPNEAAQCEHDCADERDLVLAVGELPRWEWRAALGDVGGDPLQYHEMGNDEGQGDDDPPLLFHR